MLMIPKRTSLYHQTRVFPLSWLGLFCVNKYYTRIHPGRVQSVWKDYHSPPGDGYVASKVPDIMFRNSMPLLFIAITHWRTVHHLSFLRHDLVSLQLWKNYLNPGLLLVPIFMPLLTASKRQIYFDALPIQIYLLKTNDPNTKDWYDK